MSRLRIIMLKLVRPVTRLLNKVNIRIGKPKLTGVMYQEALVVARDGDIILTRTSLRPSNLFIPGKWSHAHIIVDATNGTTVEAVIPKSRFSTMIDVWAGVSEVLIVRPVFASNKQRRAAANRAKTMIGKPYDTSFALNDKAFYCSELVIMAYKLVGTKVPMESLVTSVAGNDVITPNSFDSEHFSRVWSSKSI